MVPEEFARMDIDGASIGSNDLTQLVLGVDRDSALLGRMGYFDERDKAVLKAISNIIRAFRMAGKEVSICGQAPSVYPEFISFLINQGITSISVNPDVVNSVYEKVSAEFSPENSAGKANNEEDNKERKVSEALISDEDKMEDEGIEPITENEIDELASEEKAVEARFDDINL